MKNLVKFLVMNIPATTAQMESRFLENAQMVSFINNAQMVSFINNAQMVSFINLVIAILLSIPTHPQIVLGLEKRLVEKFVMVPITKLAIAMQNINIMPQTALPLKVLGEIVVMANMKPVLAL